MKAAAPPESGFGRNATVAFVVVVLAAYASLLGTLDQLEPWRLTLLVLMGCAFVGVGLSGLDFCSRTLGWPGQVAYFAFQILLGGAITYLGRAGLISIVLYPVASQAAACLTGRWLALVCGLILGAQVLPIALAVGPAVALQATFSLGGGLLFVVVFTQVAVSEQRTRGEVERLAQELRDANDRLRQYAVQVEELAVARERNRVAREIHDSLGHYLTAVNIQLEAARALLGADPARAQDAIGKAQGLTKEGLADVRRSVAALRLSPVEDRPLADALAALVSDSQTAGIATSLEVLGVARPLGPAAELTLFRAAQEGLTNVRKHAQAASTRVALDFRGESRVLLTILDDGIGATENGQGFGLLGVRERVQLLAGEVSTESVPGRGFKLTVSLPG